MSFFSRDELLGGLPARRASTLLFAIESRTAHFVVEARQATARYLTEKTAAAEERSFLEALAQGRNASRQVAIQDLEHYAPTWAALVPPDPGLRAALAHLIAEKYRFTSESVPRLRRALGLDDEAVAQAYERWQGRPLTTIYTPRLTIREQVRWTWARLAQWLEDMPPFWTAYALTLTETVGAGILALPIALAGVGPVAGVVLLLVFGLVSIITIVGMTEAVARNGNIRYGHAYLGRVVADYLGRPGTTVLMLALVVLCVFVLLAFYLGLSETLASATGVPAAIWAAGLFLLQLYFQRHKTLNTTIASALVVGFINIGLLVIMSIFALRHLSADYLSYVNVPFVSGRPFDGELLGLIFGVVLASYFGHLSTGACARLVLRRDPSGRALIWGNIAAMATAMALGVVWVLAVNGSIPFSILQSQTGTALTPLAALVGPVVTICGLVFVILSMGIGSIHSSLALAHQVREWIPARPDSPSHTVMDAITSARGRFVIGILPVAAVLAIAEWLLLPGSGSFTDMFWVFGVTIPVVGGVFPMLLLAASRRKGDYPLSSAIGWVGNPVIIASIYLVFLIALFLHGLVIWEDPAQRLVALATGALIIWLTARARAQGRFSSRAVVEWRADRSPGGETAFNIMIDGKPSAVDVLLRYFDGERHLTAATGVVPAFDSLYSVTFQLPPTTARELKVWTHLISTDGWSKGISARLELRCADNTRKLDLGQSNGLVLLPLKTLPCEVQLTFP